MFCRVLSELSPLQKPKQKHNSQFLGGKIQICCIVRSFYKAVWATFNPRDKSQEVIIYVEEATWKPDYQLKQPFRNKRAYIYSLYTSSQRVEINFDEAFLFSQFSAFRTHIYETFYKNSTNIS